MPQDNNVMGSPKIWVAEFIVPLERANFFIEALEVISIGIKCYEPFEDATDWVIRIYLQQKPELASLQTRVNHLADAVALPAPEVKLHEIENKNWVLELAKQFKAIQTSQFHIYSEFSEASADKINICINPGMAFGTGQHETTFLCLEAITWLQANKHEFVNILDLGCGSGILAIAAGKIWDRAKLSASDNDPIAIEVCLENAEVNSTKLRGMVSEGFANIPAQEFDLVLANILMNPLLELAQDMAKFSSGVIVLSGFKIDQAAPIQEKYESFGFSLLKEFSKNDWVSLVLSK